MVYEELYVDDLLRKAEESLGRAQQEQNGISQAFWQARVDTLREWQGFNRARQ
jgi:hypothetical protein